MSKYNSTLKAAIIAAIKNNPDPKISGNILQEQLISIVEAVDKGMLFMGTATPATTPSGQSRCCLMASRPGTYTNFTGTDGNPVVVAQGEVALLCTVFVENDMRWVKIALPVAPTSEIKVLVIGNSFVEDEFSYVPFVLKNIAPSVKLTMGIAHIGGSPLAQHTAYLTAQSETYEGVTYYVDNGACYRQEEGGEPEPVHYGYHKSVGGEAWSNIAAAWIDSHIDPTIYRIIREEQWDIIVFQADVLHGDGAWNTYYAPYVFKIAKAVFDMLNYPVKLGWAPTHSCIYSDEYSGNTPPSNADELLFRRWKGRAANSIELLQQTGFSVLFPSDTAIQNLRYMDMFKSNQMSRFGWLAWDKTGHLQEGIGPLASAYANTIVILNAMGFGYESVYGEQTRPDGTWVEAKEIPSPHGYILNDGTITWYIAGAGAHYDEYCSLAQIAAVNAVKYPFSLIDPSNLSPYDTNRAVFVDNEPASKSYIGRLLAGKANVEGTYPDLVAGDITPKSNDMVEVTNKFAAQSTGGDTDIKSGRAYLLNIKGNLDASLNPFMATALVSTAMNLVDPTAYLTIDNKKAYYFPVVPGNWGAYGTTQENNGYIVVGGNVYEVYFKATKPTAESYGTACPKHTHTNAKNYYTPGAIGWLTIVCNDNAVPACHLAWSNYNDNVKGTFNNTVKSIAADVAQIHDWGMALLSGGGRTVYDEIDLPAGHTYRRVDRAALGELNWEMATDVSSETPVHVFTFTLTGMATDGLWKANVPGLEMVGDTLTYSSTEIATVADLRTALSGKYLYYELKNVVEGNTSTSTVNTVDDFGLTYFMNGDEIATVPAYVTESFYQSGKDQLFNAVTYQKILAEVTAAALCDLDSRIRAIEGNIAEGFNYLKVVNLDVTRQLTEPQQ